MGKHIRKKKKKNSLRDHVWSSWFDVDFWCSTGSPSFDAWTLRPLGQSSPEPSQRSHRNYEILWGSLLQGLLVRLFLWRCVLRCVLCIHSANSRAKEAPASSPGPLVCGGAESWTSDQRPNYPAFDPPECHWKQKSQPWKLEMSHRLTGSVLLLMLF